MREQQETRNHKKTNKREKGITLVALVVTIIILLILAGVTISSVAGNQSLFKRAGDASNSYQKAQANELEGMNTLLDDFDKAVGEEKISGTVAEKKTAGTVISETEITTLTDDSENKVKIPAGFKIASDSATDRANGIVIEDRNKNQYVWIPVDDIADYKRTDFAKGITFTSCSETMPTDEQTSVTNNKGYYIGRYEAGIATARTAKGDKTQMTMTQLGTVLIQKNKPSYTFVTRDQAKSLSEEIDTHYGYSATTKLCSSYAWDTALTFIDKTNSGYSTNSTQGNYSGSLKNTGLTTAVCNIFDLGGNVEEWTSEACSSASLPCVGRGGVCFGSASYGAAGGRDDYGTTTAGGLGFRSTLYL